MVKRCGLVGSQSKAEESKPPSAPAKVPVGRDLVAKPTKGNRGRFGATGRGGRICGPSTGPGPLEKYLERGKVPKGTLRSNTTGTLGEGQEEETLTVKERSSVHSGAQGEDISVEPDKERDSRDPGSTPYRKSQLNRAEKTLSKVESSEESQGT